MIPNCYKRRLLGKLRFDVTILMIRNFRHAEPGEIIERAKVLKNIGQVCREARISRQTYYRWRWLYRTGRRDALKKRSRRRPHPKRRMLSIWETTIINLALTQPTWSAQRVATQLHGQEMPVSVSGVRCVWLRRRVSHKQKQSDCIPIRRFSVVPT